MSETPQANSNSSTNSNSSSNPNATPSLGHDRLMVPPPVLKPGLINPAVFAYTLYIKLSTLRNWLPLIVLLFLPSFALYLQVTMAGALLSPDDKQNLAKGLINFFISPTICLVMVYFFISDGFAGRKLIGESDNLALLFTRPITRFSYVMSKFFGGTIGAFVFQAVGLLFTALTALSLGIVPPSLSPLTFLTLLANLAGWASLVTFLHCAQPLLAILTIFLLQGFGGVGALFSNTNAPDMLLLKVVRSICLFLHEWFGDFIPFKVDLVTMFSAITFDTYEFSIFISNIIFYLFISCVALSKRSFAYASE